MSDTSASASPVDASILARPNPFYERVVHTPWDPIEDDVEAVHAAVRRPVEEAIATVAATRRARGVLIIGASGAGKTHLLAILRHRIGAGTFFVAVRPSLDPRAVNRNILDAFASDLARPRTEAEPRQIEVLVRDVLAKVGAARADTTEALRAAADAFVEHHPDIDRRLLRVLLHASAPDRGDLVLDWLRGRPLEAGELEPIGATGPRLAPDATPEAAEEAAEDTVVQLCTLAGALRPVVFAFDQNESLGDAPGLRGIDALTKAICRLHMRAPSAVLVTTIESTAWRDSLEKSMLASHRARLAEEEHILQPLKGEDAREIIAARMARVLAASGTAPPSRIYPFGDEFIRRAAEGRPWTRRLLEICGREIARLKAEGRVRAVDQVGGSGPTTGAPAAPAESVESAVGAFFDSACRSAEADARGADDAVLEDALRRVLAAAARTGRALGPLRVTAGGPGNADAVAVAFETTAGAAGRSGVAAVNAASALTLVAALRAHVRALEQRRVDRAFTLRRDRMRATWKKAIELDARVRQLGGGCGGVVDLDRRSDVALGAVARLVAGARQGDLTLAGRRVPEDDAVAALVALGRLEDVPLFETLARTGATPARSGPPPTAAVEPSRADRGALRERFEAVLVEHQLANLAFIEAVVRRTHAQADRQTLIAIGVELRDRGFLRIFDTAEGDLPTYARVPGA